MQHLKSKKQQFTILERRNLFNLITRIDMQKLFTLVIVAILALCSCSKSEINENREAASFVAALHDNTKTILNNDRSQSWLGGEVVQIFDVTDFVKGTSAVYKFTNTNTGQSTVAEFVAEDPNFKFVEGHSYYAYYGGANEANILATKDNFITLTYDKDFLYNPEGKYGLPNNSIPLSCKFKYTGKSSVQSLKFRNVVNLLVLRITNNTSESKQIGHILLDLQPVFQLTQLFGQSRDNQSLTDKTDYSTPDYVYCQGFTNNSSKSNINFGSPIMLGAGKTKDFAVFITKPVSPMLMTLNATIYDQNDGTTIGTASKNDSSLFGIISEDGGHVYVWTISI